MSRRILTGLQIVTPHEILHDHAVVIEEKKIKAIVPQNEIKKFLPAQCEEFPHNFSLLPGFIDLHIHGANGHDVMDASSEALLAISQALAKEGVTHFLATTMTAETSMIEAALVAVRDFKQEGILGVHLEGPFISPQKIGAQRAEPILEPNYTLITQWQKLSKNAIKMVTLAPETPNALPFIQALKNENIISAVGHTDASYEVTQAAIAHGSSHATHLFNAMRGIHHREPGALGALLLSDQVTAELIVDGVHLHPAMVDLAWRLKGKERLLLVTDAMRAKCLGEGEYELGGQKVKVQNHCATLSDGTLAGSTLTMSQALLNMMNITKCSLVDIVRMVAENPARIVGVFDRLGSIAVGKSADFVVLDDQYGVISTMRAGEII